METKEIIDPAFHQKLAMLCEDLGIISRAVLEYHLSLRDQPNQIPILKRLGVIYHHSESLRKKGGELEGLT